MARVPLSIVPDNGPAPTPPSDYQNIPSSPSEFGGLIGGAEQKLGQEGEQAGNAGAQVAGLLQQRYNQTTGDDAMNQFMERGDKLTYGNPNDPTAPKGLYNLKGSDALSRGPQVVDEMTNLRNEIKNNLPNDVTKLQFDNESRRYFQYKSAEISRHLSQQQDVWSEGVANSGIVIAADHAAHNFTSDNEIMAGLSDAQSRADQKTGLKYGAAPSQDMIDAGRIEARTLVIRKTIDNAMAVDPVNGPIRAQQILGKFGDLIDPATREELARGTKGAVDQAGVAGNIQNFNRGYQGGSYKAGTPFTPSNLPQGVSLDEDAMVRTVAGEAAQEPLVGQRAVASVIMNRSKDAGVTPRDVVFAPNQFEPWNGGAARDRLEAMDPNSPQYQNILNNVVRPVVAGAVPDPTGGATHFFAPVAQAAATDGRAAVPSWAVGQTPTVIGNHNFYKIGYGPEDTSGQSATTAPSSATPTHNPLPYGWEQQKMDAARAEAARLYPSQPKLQDEFTSGIWRDIERTNVTQAKYEAEAAKAQRDAQNAAMNNIITTVNHNAADFNPAMLDVKDASGKDLFLPDQRENIVSYAIKAMAEQGIENIAPYGPGYTKAYNDILASSDSPDKINDLSDIMKRGAPGGDLTKFGVERLADVFKAAHKDIDSHGTAVIENGMLNFAKSHLSFQEDTGPIKIRDPKGEDIYNAQFLPEFELGLATARATGKPEEVRKFLSRDNITSMIQNLRSPTQMARDRLAATGQTDASDVERPGMPLPPVPKFPDLNGKPAQQIDPKSWQAVLAGPLPIAENGQPFTHTGWANYITTLMQNPNQKTMDYFDKHFAVQGFSAADIVSRLRSPGTTPAPTTTQPTTADPQTKAAVPHGFDRREPPSRQPGASNRLEHDYSRGNFPATAVPAGSTEFGTPSIESLPPVSDMIPGSAAYHAANPDRPPEEMPAEGVLPGTLHLDSRYAPPVSDPAAPRPFGPGEYVRNPNGSWSSEISITVTNPGVNDGKPTILPSLWIVDGKPVRVNEDAAARYASQSGLQFRSFDTMAKAEEYANHREMAWQRIPQDDPGRAHRIAPLWTGTADGKIQHEDVGGEGGWFSGIRSLFGAGEAPGAKVTYGDRLAHYPGDEELSAARDADFSYGTGNEAYMSGARQNALSNPPRPGRTREITGIPEGGAEISDVTNPRFGGSAPGTVATADEYGKAQLAVLRSPISALGYDPRHVNLDTKTGGETTIAGAYDPKQDNSYSNASFASNIVHESTHRGLEKLREAGVVPPDLWNRLPKEEDIVRYIMALHMGDPEKGRGSSGDEQRAEALYKFGRSVSDPQKYDSTASPQAKQYRSAMNELTGIAATYYASQHPGGPR